MLALINVATTNTWTLFLKAATIATNKAMGQILIQPAIVNRAAATPVEFLLIATKPKIARAALTESSRETATGPNKKSAATNAQLACVPEKIFPLVAGRTISRMAAVLSAKTTTSQEIS